jgi:hypothetical protein
MKMPTLEGKDLSVSIAGENLKKSAVLWLMKEFILVKNHLVVGSVRKGFHLDEAFVYMNVLSIRVKNHLFVGIVEGGSPSRIVLKSMNTFTLVDNRLNVSSVGKRSP